LEYKWLALTVTTIGILMVGIDIRRAIIGLPQVLEQLGADIEQAIWITQAYVLTNTLMLSLIGRLGDISRIAWEIVNVIYVNNTLSSGK